MKWVTGNTQSMQKKPVSILPYLGSISLRIRFELKKLLKGIQNWCKLQAAKAFQFKD